VLITVIAKGLLNMPTALLLRDAGDFVRVQLEVTLHAMKDRRFV